MKTTSSMVRTVDLELPGNRALRLTLDATELTIRAGYGSPYRRDPWRAIDIPASEVPTLIEALTTLSTSGE